VWGINATYCGNDEWENDGGEIVWSAETHTREEIVRKWNTKARIKLSTLFIGKFKNNLNDETTSNWKR
jgi:hypothetical protein